MKKIIIVFICIFLCGCTTKYNLEISNNYFKEDIDILFDKDDLIIYDDEYINSGAEVDDQITPFLESDNFAIGTDKKYKKRVKKSDDYINVLMSYDYDEEEFKNSNTLNECFEHHTYKFDDVYYIHGYGNFYCLYTDNIDIVIKTKNNVINNNADEVNGNEYIWHVNSNNINNFDLEIEIEKGFSREYLIYIIVGILILLISFIIYNIAKSRNIKNNTI